MKTKLDLIKDIEAFIETNLEQVDVDKNQHYLKTILWTIQ